MRRTQWQSGPTLTSVVILLIVGVVLLASIAPALDHLIATLTVLLLVVGALAIAWKLTQFFTRR